MYRVAYQGEALTIGDALLQRIDEGQQQFTRLIERGLPSYGVTTVLEYFKPLIAPLDRDRALAADVELILEHFSRPEFIELFR